MARKRTLIPAFPVGGMVLAWALVGLGVVLMLWGGIIGGSGGMVLVGTICVAAGMLALVAERLGDGDDSG